MSARQRIVRASVGAFMALATALGLGGFTTVSASASPASAAVHHGCPLGHKGHYPPGKCRTFFNRGVYHPHQKVVFETGRVFKTHEKVSEKLTCHSGSFSENLGTTRAHGLGKAKDNFRLPKHLPSGGCTLTLTGEKSGVRLHGHFEVRK
jgi:hypothetical protein